DSGAGTRATGKPWGTLGAYTDADEEGRYAGQCGEAFQGLQKASGRSAAFTVDQRIGDDSLHGALEQLDHDGRQEPSATYTCQVARGDGAFHQGSGQKIGGRDGVLDGQVDPHTTDRGHRMGCVADAQQPVKVPAAQPVQPHVQVFDLVHGVQGFGAIGHLGYELGNVCAKGCDPAGTQLVVGALAGQVGDLQVTLAGDDHGEPTPPPAWGQRQFLPGGAGQTEPPGVEVDGKLVRHQATFGAGQGFTTVTGDGQVGVDLTGTVGHVATYAVAPAGLLEQPVDLGTHAQGEGGFLRACFGEKGEQVPLRDHRNVGVGDLEPVEGSDGHIVAVLVEEGHTLQMALWQLGEAFTQTEVVEQHECGRVHGVTTKVTQEIGVFFQDGDLYTGSGQEQARHHAGGAATDDHAGRSLAHTQLRMRGARTSRCF